MSNFFSSLAKSLGDPDIVLASEGNSAAEFTGLVDTGSYSLNALLSGSMYGGVPNNKITGFAGESATGKTYFVMGLISQWLKDNPNGGVVYFDTEAAVTKKMLADRGADPDRVLIGEPSTIQEFRHKALQIIENYEKVKEADRPPMLFVLDSLGMLSTTKEMEDSAAGKETKDMTKAQVIKAAFRVLTLKLGKLRIPMLVTNHTYDVVGAYVPTKELSGGSGFKYAASTICTLSKKKLRDEDRDVIGVLITVTTYKSRMSKENQKVDVLLHYDRGLDRYYGLLDIALEEGIFTKLAKGIDVNGKRVYEKDILANPEKYYTPEVMSKLEEACKRRFAYGGADSRETDSETSEDLEINDE